MSSAVIAGLEERFQLAQVVAQEAGKLAFHYFNERETLVIETKRDRIIRLMYSGELSDEARRHLERELDLEEARIAEAGQDFA